MLGFINKLTKKYSLQSGYILLIITLIGLIFFLTPRLFASSQMVEISHPVLSINNISGLPTIQIGPNLYLYYVFYIPLAIIYYIVPHRWRWKLVLLSSYGLLFFWEIYFLITLIIITLSTYIFGRRIEAASQIPKKRKKILNSGIAFCILIFIGSKFLPGISLRWRYSLLLPLGMSYYLFQAISYLLDIYSQKIKAESHLGYFAVYMGFFPRFFVGPIERAEKILPELKQKRIFNNQVFANGIIRIFWGLFKKLMVVNRLTIITPNIFSNYNSLSTMELWIGIFLSGLYLYFDFSAFTDIAIGISQLFGFSTTENFNRPSLATSVSDFWRRWHISLSTWLRDYVFFPLNFSTRKKNQLIMQPLNILITFLISGLWHGSSLQYLIWGGLHGFYQGFELFFKHGKKAIQKKFGIKMKQDKILSIIFTFLIVNFTWIFFLADSVEQAFDIVAHLFQWEGIFLLNKAKFGLNLTEYNVLQITIFFLLGIEILEEAFQFNFLSMLTKLSIIPRWTIYLISIFIVIIFGYYGIEALSVDPFYMQF